jgi:formylglycine-generating enzyme required for sulfatase activity
MRFFMLGLALLSLLLSSGAFSAQAIDMDYTNSIGMEFVLIPAGEFLMGSDKGKDQDADDDETPQHRVRISKPFYLGKYEVTQALWEAVMGNNPSLFKDRSNPVELVSWDDAQEFIKRLNAREGHNRYRLPTEAEWEYAVRAGTSTDFFWGEDESRLGEYAWYYGNSGHSTHPVGQKKPNPWRLYDVYGNVREWVQDWATYYSPSPATDPQGPPTGSFRAIRNGGWFDDADACRSACRYFMVPDATSVDFGFRIVLSPE